MILFPQTLSTTNFESISKSKFCNCKAVRSPSASPISTSTRGDNQSVRARTKLSCPYLIHTPISTLFCLLENEHHITFVPTYYRFLPPYIVGYDRGLLPILFDILSAASFPEGYQLARRFSGRSHLVCSRFCCFYSSIYFIRRHRRLGFGSYSISAIQRTQPEKYCCSHESLARQYSKNLSFASISDSVTMEQNVQTIFMLLRKAHCVSQLTLAFEA